MGSLDAAFRTLASTLIGITTDTLWTITRIPAASYNELTGERSTAASQQYQVKVSPPQEFSERQIDGTSIRQGDLQTYVAAADLPVTPDHQTDTISDGSTVYAIIKVTKVMSGDQAAMYDLHLRRR